MIWHILPTNDLKEHTKSSTCDCKPELIMENNNMIFQHHSYDGREYKEQLLESIKNTNLN